jgi:hypothetical protein
MMDFGFNCSMFGSIFSRSGMVRFDRSDQIGVQTLLKRSARSYWSFVTKQVSTVGFRPQANGIVERDQETVSGDYQ